MNTLEGFAGSGFLSGDNVIVIATGQHLSELNERLKKQGFDVDDLIKTKNYMPLDAQATLDKFMVNNWPDEVLFDKFITGVINTASQNNKKVRAFGEMVDLLWQNGLAGATVKLEHLWCALHAKKNFSLYCAYPKNGFTQDACHSMDSICKAHSKMIDGAAKPSTEIYYRSTI